MQVFRYVVRYSKAEKSKYPLLLNDASYNNFARETEIKIASAWSMSDSQPEHPGINR